MKNRGFTLIEIIVAMAILSIMAGTLVPLLYKTWESNEIAVTRGRMLELKKAMVGDRALVQQGIRTHYGFAGDNGLLPTGIQDLVSDSGSFANWNGPYLGGFDPATYASDAWGNGIAYVRHNPFLAVSGLSVAATLRSAGPDRTFGTGDDIDEISDLALQILGDDVWPTEKMQGNRSYTFSAAPAAPATNYYADLQVNYNTEAGSEMGGEKIVSCDSMGVDTATTYPFTVSKSFTFDLTDNLPVGRVVLSSSLFSDSACTNLVLAETDVAIFVSDGQKTIFVNPPPLYH
jgi:general secretion pathway protein G